MKPWLAPILVVAGTVGIAVSIAVGCGTSATGVGACNQIEDARCQAAASCSSSDFPPVNTTNGSSTDACIRFYDTACLHGLEVATPSQTAINYCVTAIKTKGCAVVAAPWTNPACSWLVPPDSGSPSDAASDVDAGDAGDSGDADAESDGSSE